MRTAPTSGAFGVRIIALAALVAALLFALGQARDARADHLGKYGFETATATVDEGDPFILTMIVLDRSGSGNVSVGVDITLTSAEAGDLATGDFCVPISGLVGTEVPVSIPTNVDADNDDETFTATLTFNTATVPCANDGGGHAIISGQASVSATINDTGSTVEDNTFEFTATSSTAEEGDVVVLNVLRNGDLEGAASVDCDVTGGTGEASDYTITDDTANFGDNDSTGTCQITIDADGDADVSETLIVSLINPVNGTVGTPAQHTITILDAEAEIVQFSSATYTVDEDGGTASFTITRTNPSGTDVFTCITDDIAGQADAGEDYTAQSDTITFSGSESSETCTVPILDDNESEGAETFRLILEQESGDAILGAVDEAIVTITDDELQQEYEFESATYTVNEAAGSVTVTVVRSSSTGTGAVDWDITGGTASAGVDYVDASGTVFFSAGETSDTFTITILTSVLVEANETILVSLSDPVNGTLGTPNQTTITITEVAPPTVTSVTPSTLLTAGGQSVVIAGTNLTGATAVTFCGVNATSFVVNNATQISAVSPAHAAGPCDVRVTTPGGTSANTAADNVTYSAAAVTFTYNLSARWSLIAWLGKDNISIVNALQGVESGTDNPSTNNIFSVVTAVATWNNATQRYLFWFPGGGNVPGANDISTFDYGTPYWIAITNNVNWTVIEGP